MPSVRLAKFLMKQMESLPSPDDATAGGLSEIFDHPIFTDGNQAERQRIMLESSEAKYAGEFAYPWDGYFDLDLAPLLSGKEALDLGCFTGGVSVAWYERYGLTHISGVDVRPEYIEAATQFASLKGADADFRLGSGESIPYEDESFDAILTFDVFEHVQNLDATLTECYRVLRPGGQLFAVFPGYFQPIEHHLSLVTRTPFLHWIFSGRTLIKAYTEIIATRGESAVWYARSAELAPWERLNTINGTTARRFRKMVRQRGWNTISRSKKPMGSIGRRASQHRGLKMVSAILGLLTPIPILDEFLLHRVTYVLGKPTTGSATADQSELLSA